MHALSRGWREGIRSYAQVDLAENTSGWTYRNGSEDRKHAQQCKNVPSYKTVSTIVGEEQSYPELSHSSHVPSKILHSGQWDLALSHSCLTCC